MVQQIETIVGAQADVGQYEVVRFVIDRGDPLGQACGRIGWITLVGEPVGHGVEDLTIVIHQKKRSALFHYVTYRLNSGRLNSIKAIAAAISACTGRASGDRLSYRMVSLKDSMLLHGVNMCSSVDSKWSRYYTLSPNIYVTG
jgi:hypothetical protein